MHLYYDWDRLDIPITTPSDRSEDKRTHPLRPILSQIAISSPLIFRQAVIRSGLTSILGPFVYMILLRKRAWSFTLYFAKMFWNFPRSADDPPGLIPPLHTSLLFRSAVSGVFLLVMWQMSNLLFSVFLGQAPLKKGLPLTNGAKDPNGSLINGLKAKRGTLVAFALWELCLISQDFADRRKGIFSDIDREGGSAWSQVLNATSEILKGISTRITDFQAAPPATAPISAPKEAAEVSQPPSSGPVQLPRLSSALKEDNIFLTMPRGNSRPDKFEAAFGTVAKSYGQSADWTPSAKAIARQAFDRASAIVLSPEQKQKISASAQELKQLTSATVDTTQAGNSSGILHPFLQKLLRSPVGAPLRRSYARRLREVVLGSPYEQTACIIDASESLARLLVASLSEDQFGKVQNDVPAVVRLFTDTILTLESFTSDKGLNVHWTDVDFPVKADEETKKNARKVENVELVLCSLKHNLSELLAAFRPYLSNVGVVGKDLRLARQAAGLSALD